MVDDNGYQVVRYIDLAMDPVPGEESAVDDFAMQLLRMMGYVNNRTLGIKGLAQSQRHPSVHLRSGDMLRQTSVSWMGPAIYSSFRKTNNI
jgi:hypothetical protein